MPRMMRSVEVKASPNKVREFLCDAQRMSSYLPVTRVEAEDQAYNRRRVSFCLDYGDGPIQIEAQSELDRSGRKIKCYATKGMRLEQTWVLQQITDGTQITYIVDYEPVVRGLAGVLRQGRSRKRMFQSCCASLERLRYHLERQASVEGPMAPESRDLAA